MLLQETEIAMNLPTAEFDPNDRPKAAMRYTYPSGSKPLEGYTIKRGVGRGGFGEVYFSVSDAGKEVALKLIRRNLDVEVRGVTHCLNLKHPNLIALYDIRTDEHDDRWVVMEYVSGESLEDAIDRHPHGMPKELALQWFAGIAGGVAYLHDHGIVHRDLKPGNIFLDESTVKIGDYGLSKFISCSRRSGQTESVGTVHYMAPEIANGRYGKEIDTYALGIILYEMLTGHVPFEGESVGEVLMKHLTAEPDLSALEEPYLGLVQRAMAKDPDTRFKSVAEMIRLLPESAATGVPPSTSAAHGKNHQEHVTAAPAPPVQNSDEEPILASLRSGWHELQESFRNSEMHPLLKSVIGFAIVIALVSTSPEWLPMFVTVGFCYLVYRAIRSIVVPSNPATAKREIGSAGKFQVASLSPGQEERAYRQTVELPPQGKHGFRKNRRLRHSWRQKLNEHLSTRPLRERIAEILGGMLVAAAVAAIASLLVCLIATGQMRWELYAWMTLTTTLASWAIMVPGKLAEGKVEDQAPLRFTQLVMGAFVGLLAWSLADTLLLALPVWNDLAVAPWNSVMDGSLGLTQNKGLVESFSSGALRLSLPVYVAYFAFLFVILAWWRQAEVSRSSRVSLWSITWCGLVAWMLHFVWWFPQPIGLLVAVVMAFTIQLSSPWMPPSQRRALAETEV